MKMSNKMITMVVLLLAIAVLVGNSGNALAKQKVGVGLIALEFGSQSFNDDILAGLRMAEKDLNIRALPLEVPSVSDVANSLRILVSQGVEFIVISTSEFRDGMIEVAEEYPDVKFLYLSEQIEGYHNIMSVAYREHEAAFLAGALGGLLTKTNTLGAVLALQESVQHRYENGFKAGVRAVNPEAQVLVAFTNSYVDIGKGKEVANAMYQRGADFVGTYAGACNLGVFSAAEDAGAGKYAFGAANGQFDESPDKILASVVKPVDQAIYGIIEEYLEGKFDASVPKMLGLKEAGVTLLLTQNPELLKLMSEDVQNTLQELAEKVMSGEIRIPATGDELKDFDYKHGA